MKVSTKVEEERLARAAQARRRRYLPHQFKLCEAVEPALLKAKKRYAGLGPAEQAGMVRDLCALVGEPRLHRDQEAVRASVEVPPGRGPDRCFLEEWDRRHDVGGAERHLNVLYGLALDANAIEAYLSGGFE